MSAQAYSKEDILRKEQVDAFKADVANYSENAKKFQKIEGKVGLALVYGAPIGLFAFSRYKNYSGKKTALVTIGGSILVVGLVFFNGFSGAWSGGGSYLQNILFKRPKINSLPQTKQAVPLATK